MDVSRLDLNLLVVFDAIYRERSVGKAARALNLSQPAVSGSLARLRLVTGDKLFLRTGAGMVPTQRAVELAPPVQNALFTLRRALIGQSGEFDAASSTRAFTLLLSEIGQIRYLPALSERLAQIAPGVRLKVSRMPPSEHIGEFERGNIDLAIGFWPHLKTAVHAELLDTDDWMCVVRADHPQIGDTISLKTYLELEHITVASGSGGDGIISRLLGKDNLARKIALEVTDFLAPPLIVAKTNLIATAPSQLAEAYAEIARLKLLPAPLRLPPIELQLYWHRRSENDQGRIWLTQLARELLSADGVRSSGSGVLAAARA